MAEACTSNMNTKQRYKEALPGLVKICTFKHFKYNFVVMEAHTIPPGYFTLA